ncbi:hypothetical protein C7Y69_09425 [Alteromonas sp. KS69]|uniref:hypothetical protein n=1 Tax=Alteromonas sp. KS69 TaxID=2109917 RepID=UPI000F88CA71|nr:hypothetical protein [Alteromonas sp. KS69]RUP81355.1 hypothetical protein C7Y69_09425 [Alteromonas sp. KS69]|tara:strand:- start:1386 stop:2300 length:915 start_codon:yes stop_codon:yes gene_type:complete
MDSSTLSVLTSSINIKEGEYLPAYVSRLLSYSSFLKPQEFYGSFSLGVPRTSEGYLPLWALKFADSGVLGKPHLETLDEHLCGSFWRPFASKDVLDSFVSKQYERRGTGRVLFKGEKALTKYAPLKYCERCRDEEIEQLGFPVWKSRNQLPTVFTCEKHKDVLHQKLSNSAAVPDGKSDAAFEQTGGEQLEISMFHRWLEFESDMIMRTECRDGNGMLKVYRDVFLESSFFQGANSTAGKRLNSQWLDALRRYLFKLFPYQRDELWHQLKSVNIGIRAMMDVSTPVHPLLLLLFKTFYMFEYKG